VNNVKSQKKTQLSFVCTLFVYILGYLGYKGQVLNWNGEWMRRRGPETISKFTPFMNEGGSLSYRIIGMDGTEDFACWVTNLSLKPTAGWIGKISGPWMTPICQYQGKNIYFLLYQDWKSRANTFPMREIHFSLT
jgi:hypothetical protein